MVDIAAVEGLLVAVYSWHLCLLNFLAVQHQHPEGSQTQSMDKKKVVLRHIQGCD